VTKKITGGSSEGHDYDLYAVVPPSSIPGQHSEETPFDQHRLPPGWMVSINLPKLTHHEGLPGEPREISAGH